MNPLKLMIKPLKCKVNKIVCIFNGIYCPLICFSSRSVNSESVTQYRMTKATSQSYLRTHIAGKMADIFQHDGAQVWHFRGISFRHPATIWRTVLNWICKVGLTIAYALIHSPSIMCQCRRRLHIHLFHSYSLWKGWDEITYPYPNFNDWRLQMDK